MQVRYRYRLYPSPGQQQALARVFGCARVVYNDCLVRHEVLRERVEVKDHHRRAVAAAR
jgi:putative transposase